MSSTSELIWPYTIPNPKEDILIASIKILLVALRQAPWLAPLALLPATIKIVVGAGQWQDKRSLNIVRLGLTEMAHTLVFAGLVILAF